MLLAHALALAEARTFLAALADLATTQEGSRAYDHALHYLDSLHAGEIPGPTIGSPVVDLDTTYGLAVSAIEDLATHGVHPLQVELVLAMLEDARSLDAPA
ncbi:hypothetical protein [Nocardioides sp. YIM 152588]|uniref:hypothetical protein n=1 Tax=Nocardioides sp. YIM 152588 TaxID=3158259 RepID=UPI0032E4543C